MHTTLWRSRAARRVQPKCRLVFMSCCRRQIRRGSFQYFTKAGVTCRGFSHDQDVVQPVTLVKYAVSNLPEQGFVNNHDSSPSIPEDVLVLRRAKQGVERYRYRYYFDGAKIRVKEFRTI